MFWFKVWFFLAFVMLFLLIVTHAAFSTIGISFLAWCGGVVSTLAVQERFGFLDNGELDAFHRQDEDLKN